MSTTTRAQSGSAAMQADMTTTTILAFHSLAILGELQYVGTLVQTIELLHIVIGRTNRSEVVEPDQVWTPLPSLDMSEERSIGSLIYHVGIALQTCHEGCL